MPGRARNRVAYLRAWAQQQHPNALLVAIEGGIQSQPLACPQQAGQQQGPQLAAQAAVLTPGLPVECISWCAFIPSGPPVHSIRSQRPAPRHAHHSQLHRCRVVVERWTGGAAGAESVAKSGSFLLPPALAVLLEQGVELGDADDQVKKAGGRASKLSLPEVWAGHHGHRGAPPRRCLEGTSPGSPRELWATCPRHVLARTAARPTQAAAAHSQFLRHACTPRRAWSHAPACTSRPSSWRSCPSCTQSTTAGLAAASPCLQSERAHHMLAWP
jgi:hypothetical protein